MLAWDLASPTSPSPPDERILAARSFHSSRFALHSLAVRFASSLRCFQTAASDERDLAFLWRRSRLSARVAALALNASRSALWPAISLFSSARISSRLRSSPSVTPSS